MKEIIGRLNASKRAISDISDKQHKLSLDRSKAETNVAELEKSGKTDDDTVRSHAFWRSKLALIPAQEDQLQTQRTAAEDRMFGEARELCQGFYDAVNSLKNQKHAQLIKLLEPFVSHPSIADRLAQQCCAIEALRTKLDSVRPSDRITRDVDIVATVDQLLGEYEAFCREGR